MDYALDRRLPERVSRGGCTCLPGDGPASSPRNRSPTPATGSRPESAKAKIARELGCSRRVLYDALSAHGAYTPSGPMG